MATTYAAALIAERLDRPIDEYLTEQRAAGASFARIAAELYKATGVLVSYETVRRWARESEDAA